MVAFPVKCIGDPKVYGVVLIEASEVLRCPDVVGRCVGLVDYTYGQLLLRVAEPGYHIPNSFCRVFSHVLLSVWTRVKLKFGQVDFH